jgi:predicted XRE-type DNA-binding protein
MRKSKDSTNRTNSDFEIIESSGNVFVDLGFPKAEAENLLARTVFMAEIKKVIRENEWTQVEAAQRLGVSQPRISDLMHGRIEKFSVDMLMKWLERLDRRVVFTIEQRDKAG